MGICTQIIIVMFNNNQIAIADQAVATVHNPATGRRQYRITGFTGNNNSLARCISSLECFNHLAFYRPVPNRNSNRFRRLAGISGYRLFCFLLTSSNSSLSTNTNPKGACQLQLMTDQRKLADVKVGKGFSKGGSKMRKVSFFCLFSDKRKKAFVLKCLHEDFLRIFRL